MVGSARRQQSWCISAAVTVAVCLSLPPWGCAAPSPRPGEEKCAGETCRDAAWNGGWDPASSPSLDTTFCNIPRVDMPRDAAKMRYSPLLKRPIIFRRKQGVDGNAAARKACERARLMDAHGDDTVILSSANTYSYDKKRVKLSAYLEPGSEFMKQHGEDALANQTWYMFGDNDHPAWKDVFGAYIEPPYYSDHERLTGYETALSFGIGGSGTGVPFHVHGGGFSEVLWGRKRWFLTQEGVVPQFDPNRTTLWWLNHDYKDTIPANLSFLGGVYDCVIDVGEVLWFPANWYHATLNIGQTVFMSTFV